MTPVECPHAAGQEPGMQHREKCQDQDSGELTGKMSPVTRPGGRQLFLFPPGSGSGGSWIKLCWGCYIMRREEGDTQVSNEAWEMSAAVIPDLCNR